MTVEDDLLAVARRQLAPSTRWVLGSEQNPRGFVFVADHPASAGLVLDLTKPTEEFGVEARTFDRDEAERHLARWMRDREFAVADAAPELVHSDTVAGVRNLALAFDWPTVQVRAVAFLLFDAGAVTADEAAWLAGFVASDAPMVATSPTG